MTSLLARLLHRVLGDAARIGRRLHQADYAAKPFGHRPPRLPSRAWKGAGIDELHKNVGALARVC